MEFNKKSLTQINSMTGKSRNYFNSVESGNPLIKMYVCVICTGNVNGTKSSNLVSHIKTVHPDIYLAKIKPPEKGSLIHLRVKRLKLLQSCVKKTTIDQEPFAAILKKGFQEIIATKLKKFEEANIRLNLTDPNLFVVKDHIKLTAEKIREKIKIEMKGRLFSLMADAATKNNRSVLGISAQFIVNSELKIRSLGVKQLTDSHTGEYLSSVVKDCLNKFGCELPQAIAVTADNASNMSKMVKELNASPCESHEINSNEIESERSEKTLGNEMPELTVPNEQIDCDLDIELFLQRAKQLEADEIDALLIDDDDDADTCSDLISEIQKLPIPPIFLSRLNCSSHTLQLVVKDALKKLKKQHANVIALCREFAKFVRRQTSINELLKHGMKIKFPKLDCLTRWSYTYLMLLGVLDCWYMVQFFADKNELCKLLSRKIGIIHEIVDALKIFYEATVLSQKPSFTLNEFYKCCIIAQLKLNGLIKKTPKTQLASHLLKSMKSRENQLIGNELMQCAKVLDPRFCDELDAEQMKQAKEKLLSIWEKVKAFRDRSQNINTTSEPKQISNSDLFAEYLKNKSKVRNLVLENTSSDEEVSSMIDEFVTNEALTEESEQSWSIFNFWEDNKKKFPILYELAMVIFSVSPTQVTIERTFSVWGYIFNDFRSRLSQELLEDVLMICLNQDLLDEVNEEDILKLMQTEKK